MSVQMTIRVDDELAAFVDQEAQEADASRAEIINRALRREIRRRTAQRDAQIYASVSDPDLDSDAYAAWTAKNAAASMTELD
jgi:predicted transcriptional regulator